MQRRLKKAQVSYRAVYRLYKENALMARRKPRSITKRNLKAAAVEDLALHNFYAQIPMMKLLGDITKMKCRDGMLYLAATLDCFDGAIAGMKMDGNKRAEKCKERFMSTVRRYGRTGGMRSEAEHG
jgi:putative transposase